MGLTVLRGTWSRLSGRRLTAGHWLVLVALGYLVVELLTLSGRGFSFDETVYVSQVSLHAPAAFFSAPRARGITWIAAPAAAFTTSPTIIRTWMAAVSAAGLAAAYWPWLSVSHRPARVPVAAVIFAALWTTDYYGAQVMPDLWVALAALWTTGWLLRAIRPPRRWRPWVGVVAGTTVTALIRPSDELFLAASLLVAVVLVRPRLLPRALAATAAGTVAGWMPWIVEAYVRFGGVRRRLHLASALQGGTSPHLSVLTVLRGSDGPVLCRPCQRAVPTQGAVVWIALVVLAATAVILACRHLRDPDNDPGAVVAALVAVGLAVPYALLITYTAPRFLLPTEALLSIAVADVLVLVGVARWLPGGRAVLVTVSVALVGLLAVTQGLILGQRERDATHAFDAWDAVATSLRAHGVTRPCVLIGSDSVPIAYDLSCAPRQLGGTDSTITLSQVQRLAATEPVVVLSHPHPITAPWVTGWQRWQVNPPYKRPYYLAISPCATDPHTPGCDIRGR